MTQRSTIPARTGRSASVTYLPLPTGAALNPAHVVRCEPLGGPVLVLLADGRTVEPEWALPYRYIPAQGDVLLVVSRGERHYALSVMHGRGRSQVAFHGDAALRAKDGSLKLRGDRGVRFAGPRVTLRAKKALEVVARVVHEKVREATSRIAGRVFERAGASRRVIEQDDWYSAGQRTMVAKDSVLFNGDLIRIS